MAIKTVLIDDFDGSALPGTAQTTTFAFNGAQYEIDLGPDNVVKLADALAPFIKAGRRVSGDSAGRAVSSGRRRPASRGDLAAIRTWAQANGYKVGDRGRIPADVVAAYAAR